MKKGVLVVLALVASLFAEGSRESDSLALVAIFTANGWQDRIDFSKPLDTWSNLTITNNRVDTLDLENFQTIPNEISNLTELKVLAIRVQLAPMQQLPETIFSLPNLETLVIVESNIYNLPQDIRNLKSLKSLIIFGSNIISLPAEIAELPYLDTVIFNEVSLQTLPIEIINSRISTFLLDDHFINEENISTPVCNWLDEKNPDWRNSRLPESILGNWETQKILSTIQSINPQSTLLWSIFDSLSSWEGVEVDEVVGDAFPIKLASLDISNRDITLIPNTIRKLEKLAFFDLSNNRLSTLPSHIIGIPGLDSANVGGNYLDEEALSSDAIYWLNKYDPDWRETQKPITNGKIKNQLWFFKETNPFSKINWDIREDITRWPGVVYDEYLKDIVSIDINSTFVDSLTSEISQFKRLSELNLSNNLISTLPEEIGNLPYLKSLDLSNNNLKELPENIEKLTPIQQLDVSGNNIKEIYLKSSTIEWLDKYDPDWRETQGVTSIKMIEMIHERIFAAQFTGSAIHFSVTLPADSKVALYDLSGREVMRSSVQGRSMSVPPIAKGIYLMQIKTMDFTKNMKVTIQ